MRKKFVIGVDGSGIDAAIRGVNEYQQWLRKKTDELASRLADRGQTVADVNFSAAYYDGINDVKVTVEKVDDGHYKVMAGGEAVLFIEFGSGLIGYGHPEVQNYGPGTYPPTDPAHPHWNQPHGWYYTEDGESHHTHGNPPSAAMYNAIKELEQDFSAIVREVFET